MRLNIDYFELPEEEILDSIKRHRANMDEHDIMFTVRRCIMAHKCYNFIEEFLDSLLPDVQKYVTLISSALVNEEYRVLQMINERIRKDLNRDEYYGEALSKCITSMNIGSLHYVLEVTDDLSYRENVLPRLLKNAEKFDLLKVLFKNPGVIYRDINNEKLFSDYYNEATFEQDNPDFFL